MTLEKQSNWERIKQITDSIEQGIKDLFQSGKYAEYLKVMSRFHHYSPSNTMLIFMQAPKATHVAGYQSWQTKFGRHVKRGEKGITILAPTPYKKKIEEMKVDPQTQAPILDENGNAVIEEKEIKIPMFKPVAVFDISQTDGPPLPTLAENLTGDVQNYDVFMEAVRRSSPVPISFEPMEANTDGYFNLDRQEIHLREGMSEVQTVCAAIHEIAHAVLHNKDAEEKSRQTEEIEAESVAFTICAYYGIDTEPNSFGYLADVLARPMGITDMELTELKASLDTINKTSGELIDKIDRNYAEIMKDREVEQLAEVELLPDPTIMTEMMFDFGYTDSDMLPLSKDRALELLERDVTVYMLYGDNTEAMVFDTEDIVNHDGLFGVTREEWEAVKQDIPPRDSDIVALKRDDVVSYHCGDAADPKEVFDFGELTTDEKKPSVLKQLKEHSDRQKPQNPPKKNKETER